MSQLSESSLTSTRCLVRQADSGMFKMCPVDGPGCDASHRPGRSSVRVPAAGASYWRAAIYYVGVTHGRDGGGCLLPDRRRRRCPAPAGPPGSPRDATQARATVDARLDCPPPPNAPAGRIPSAHRSALCAAPARTSSGCWRGALGQVLARQQRRQFLVKRRRDELIDGDPLRSRDRASARVERRGNSDADRAH